MGPAGTPTSKIPLQDAEPSGTRAAGTSPPPPNHTDLSQPRAKGQFKCCLKAVRDKHLQLGKLTSPAEQGEAGHLHLVSPRAALAPLTCPRAPCSEATRWGGYVDFGEQWEAVPREDNRRQVHSSECSLPCKGSATSPEGLAK